MDTNFFQEELSKYKGSQLNEELINYLFHLHKQQIEKASSKNNEHNSRSYSLEGRGTNWDISNNITVNKWITECEKQNYLYDRVLDNIRSEYNKISLLIFIIVAITSAFEYIQIGLSQTTYPQIYFAIKIILIILTTLTTIFTGYVQISNFSERMEVLKGYTGRLANFLSNLISEMSMKPELRKDGNDFILQNTEIYNGLYRDSPFIKENDYKKGIELYNKFIEPHNLETGQAIDYSQRNRIKLNSIVIKNKNQDKIETMNVKKEGLPKLQQK